MALGAVVSPLVGALVTTDIYVVSAEDPVDEDVYVTATRAIVDGTIDGDLTVFAGDVTINGEVTGSIQVMSVGSVRVTDTGRVGGSISGAAVNVTVEGDVESDVFVAGASIVVEEGGAVGRDAMTFGGVARIEGSVGRDVRGRTYRTVVTGSVGGDIDIAAQRVEVGPTAVVEGDILYRSATDASIDPAATVGGTITQLPTQANFIYGIILSLADLVSLLAFVVAGIVILMAMRGTGSRATGAVIMTPIRTILYGLAAVIVAPALVVVLAATLVGLPLAIFVAMLIAAALVLGPVPAVAALGNRMMLGRGGLLGAFVLGAVVWRLGIWAIPLVGGVLYLVALVWGVGAWIAGAVASRRKDPLPLTLLPATMLPAPSTVPEGWQPPRAPIRQDIPDPESRIPETEHDPRPVIPESRPDQTDRDLAEDDADPDDGPGTDAWGLPKGLRD